MLSKRIKVNRGGAIVIPAEYRKALNIKAGDTLLIFPEAGGLKLETIGQAIKQAQAIVRSHVPKGVSLVDELIQERRREAAKEEEELNTH